MPEGFEYPDMKRRDFIQKGIGGLAGIGALKPPPDRRPFSPRTASVNRDQTPVLVKILGTAQDGGLPQLGCSCRNCRRAWKNPQLRRLIASLAVIDTAEKKCFLVDATPDIRAQWELLTPLFNSGSFEYPRLPDGILLTHAHIGHYTGLMFYGYESGSAHELPVHCSTRMSRFLALNGPWSQLVEYKNISLRTFRSDRVVRLTSNISFTPLLVPHRDEFSDTHGFLIEGPLKKLLYIPDIQSWESWRRSISEEALLVDFALLDGTFYSPEELPGRDLSGIGHPFIQDSLRILRDLPDKKRTRIHFTHLNHSNPAAFSRGEAAGRIRSAGFEVAWDGLEFHI